MRLLAAMSAARVMAIVALLLGLTAIVAMASVPMRRAGSAAGPYVSDPCLTA